MTSISPPLRYRCAPTESGSKAAAGESEGVKSIPLVPTLIPAGMTFFLKITGSGGMTNLWTFIKERTRGVVQNRGEQEDKSVSFEKIPDIVFVEDIEVGALLNEWVNILSIFSKVLY